MDFTAVDLYKLIHYSPDRFLEFIKPRIKEYFNYLNTTTINTGRINPYETISAFFKIKIKYSYDIKIRKRGRMVFGGIKVEIEGDTVDLIVNDMLVDIVGKIRIDLGKDLCRFYKWERDEKGEFNIGPLDCNTIRDVLHYDTPGDLR